MFGNDHSENARPSEAQGARHAPPFGGLWSMGIAVTLALVFASTMPQPFFLPVFGELLFFGAIGATLAAVIRRCQGIRRFGVAADRPVVRVSELSFDPAGPDDDALGQEFITIVNEGYGRVSIANWVLRDESSSNRLTFPSGTVLAVGESVTVVTGCEGGPADAIYWCSDTPVWSNGGDTAIVSDTLGNAVIWYTYTAADQ